MPIRYVGFTSYGMKQELKELLARELCAMIEGWTQDDAASVMGLHQSQLSRIRNGKLEGFSASRLISLIAARGYNVEIHLKPIPRRLAQPYPKPSVAVVRYDRYGRVAE